MIALRHVQTARLVRLRVELGEREHHKEVIMATQTVQQVMDYLKSHPEIAKKASQFAKTNPDQVKEALQDVARERGWDLSSIDTAELKSELSKLAH